MKRNVKKLSFLLFGLVLMLAACGGGGSSSTESKGDEKNNASESNSTDEKHIKLGLLKLLSIHR